MIVRRNWMGFFKEIRWP